MEEQMIQDFVHRVSRDEELRKELASDPNAVITREGFSTSHWSHRFIGGTNHRNLEGTW